MSSATLSIIERGRTLGLTANASRPDLLIATDGTVAADGAVCVGSQLSARQQFDFEVLTVLRHNAELANLVDAESRVRAQLRMFGPTEDNCRIAMHSGPVAPTIARVAREHRVGMVVMGMTRHGVRGLLPGAGTLSQLLPLGETPILAVPSNHRYIPTRLMIAVDFSMPSIRAARTAIEMISSFSRIDIVHVESQEAAAFEWNPWEETYDGGIRGAFERLIGDLKLPRKPDIETWTLKGDVSSELLRFAERSGCDVISAGGRDHGLLDQLRVRSVTRELLHRAPCSLLIAPRRPASAWMHRTRSSQPAQAFTFESPIIPQHAR